MEPWRGADMVWKQHKQCHDCKQHGLSAKVFCHSIPEIETAHNTKTWHGLAQMGYQELFAHFDIIQWSHGEEQTWFGSSINSVMTENSMGYSAKVFCQSA